MKVTLAGRVVNVAAGDLVDIEIRRTVRVRLLECHVADPATTPGIDARAKLIDITFGRPVELDVELDDLDLLKRGWGSGRVRTLGPNGVDVAAVMVADGFAVARKGK